VSGLEVFVIEKLSLSPKEVQDGFIKKSKGVHLPLLVTASDRDEYLVFCEGGHAGAFSRFLAARYVTKYTSNNTPPDYPWAQQAEAVSAILARNNDKHGC